MSAMSNDRHCATCTCGTRQAVALTITPTDCTLESMDDAISCLENEIRAKKAVLIEVKMRRNALLPISRIPLEVLCEVFAFYRELEYEGNKSYYAQLCSLVQVSSGWRAAALSDPRLWNTINLRFPSVVNKFAERCGAVPLCVFWSQSEVGDADVEDSLEISTVDALCDLRNPIAELELRGEGKEILLCLERLLPNRLDKLQSLAIITTSSYGMLDLDALLQVSLPHLHTMTIDFEANFLWGCPLLMSCASSLRDLSLSGCTFSARLTALPELLFLQKLSFKNIFYPVVSDERPKITLPALTRLQLDDEPKICITLLKQLQLPPHCSITVDNSIGYTALAGELEDLVEYMTLPRSSRINIHIKADEVRSQVAGHDGCLKRTLGLNIYDCPITREDLLRITCGLLGSEPGALSIIVDSGISLSTTELAVLCGDAVDSVRSITFGGDGLHLEALADCLSLYETFLPRLARLQIDGADFTQLQSTAVQSWAHGFYLRRKVLQEIVANECTNVPPAPYAVDMEA